MVADKILMDVTLDRETHGRLKEKTGVNVLNGADLMRAIVRLLNMYDMQQESIEKFLQKSNKQDNVNHPQHYKQGGMECIEEMLLVFGLEETMSFCKLNTWKYRKRAMHKGTAKLDMEKSDAYLRCYKALKEKGIAEF